MGLRIDPAGGGQLNAALKTIIEAERQPIRTLEARKKVEESKMKLFQEFKGKFSAINKALEDISSYNNFRELKVDLGGDENRMDVKIDKTTAHTGNYEIKINELAKRSSMISRGMNSPDVANLGVGFVVIPGKDGEQREIFVDEKNSSLNGIASLINNDKSSSVQATVLQDLSDPDRSWRLVMSAKKDGEANNIDFPEFYFLSGEDDIWIDESKGSQNAFLDVDGFQVESAGNKISNFLSGVNLHLKQADPEKTITMSITEDPKKVSGKMKSVVDQVNGVLEFVNKQNAVDKESDTRTMFTGDTTLQNIEWRLRNLMHEGFPVQDTQTGEYSYVFMHEIGVQFGKDGKLTFNEEKFEKAADGDFGRIAEAITSEMGFAAQLKQVFSNYTRPADGALATKEAALRSRMKNIDQNIETKERNLERKQQQLKEQFSKLQASLNNMQQQQSYLTQALGGSGGNLVSQLLG